MFCSKDNLQDLYERIQLRISDDMRMAQKLIQEVNQQTRLSANHIEDIKRQLGPIQLLEKTSIVSGNTIRVHERQLEKLEHVLNPIAETSLPYMQAQINENHSKLLVEIKSIQSKQSSIAT